MARKKKNDELLLQSYTAVDDEHKISDMSIIDQVNKLVDMADEVLTKICQSADTIRIHTYDEIVSSYPELPIPRNVWLELVNIRKLKLFTEIPEKVLNRMAQSYDGAKNVTALRESLLGNLVNDRPLKVSSLESEKALEYEQDYELDEKFISMLNNCASIRHIMDTVLWPKLKQYGDAFCYITKEPYNTFKFLLDIKHYKGGWPSETTPSKLFKAVAGFRYVFETLTRYENPDIINLLSRFGLSITMGNPHPSRFCQTENGKLFSKYPMFKMKDEAIQDYNCIGVMPWYHMVLSNHKLFCYVWDTRRIENVIPESSIDANDLTTDFIDSCHPLINASNFDVSEIEELLVHDNL